jgi:hypothetical protein
VSDGKGQVRILFIGGWGRCGSTLLDMMLGQVPGVVSAGEVREIWLRGCVEDRPCGCGRAFSNCPFWTSVGEHAFGGWDQLDLQRTLRTRYRLDRPWGVPRLLVPENDNRPDDDLSAYGDVLAQLYRGIAAASGAGTIIDSSKIPSHALMLRRVPELEARVLHLVRDSRGVAYSNTKRVEKASSAGASTLLPRHGSMASSARFDFYNGLTAALRAARMPYLRLRYEDVIADPRRRLHEILAYAGVTTDGQFPFLNGPQLTLAENHLVDGNPVRFAKNPLTLKLDEQWRSEMSPRARAAVTILTSPLLRTYGYQLR